MSTRFRRTLPETGRRRRIIRIAIGALCLVLVSACATTGSLPLLPPLTAHPTELTKPGKFVWVDLVTQDLAASKSFYGALFGWTFREGDRYTPVLREGEPIAGIIEASDPERGSEWVPNLSVADVDRAAELVVERGGLLERDPTDAPDRGRLALVTDKDGALLLLLRASGGDPPDADPVVGGWLWQELWSHDMEAALSLYTELVGYDSRTVDFRDQAYHVFLTEDRLRAGVVPAPPEVNALWLPYVRVEDAEASAARAESLGARIVMQDDHSAILVDPTGAAVGVGEWTGKIQRQVEGAR